MNTAGRRGRGRPKSVVLDYDSGEFHSVTVRMPAELHEAIKMKAARIDRPVAQAIRRAIRLYVESKEN